MRRRKHPDDYYTNAVLDLMSQLAKTADQENRSCGSVMLLMFQSIIAVFACMDIRKDGHKVKDRDKLKEIKEIMQEALNSICEGFENKKEWE